MQTPAFLTSNLNRVVGGCGTIEEQVQERQKHPSQMRPTESSSPVFLPRLTQLVDLGKTISSLHQDLQRCDYISPMLVRPCQYPRTPFIHVKDPAPTWPCFYQTDQSGDDSARNWLCCRSRPVAPCCSLVPDFSCRISCSTLDTDLSSLAPVVLILNDVSREMIPNWQKICYLCVVI
jgi:hypothetical protein